MAKNKTLGNTIMLYIMTFAKMAFPLITLPYLTRMLSVDGYAVVAYVKSAMVYVQILIDFGFGLSAVKEIALVVGDKEKVSKVLGTTMMAKFLLAGIGLIIIAMATLAVPILRENWLYTLLAYISIAMSVFIPDFLFRGIEKMHVVTIRFVVARGISTLLTVLVVKNDNMVLLIPCLDMIGTLVAAFWSWYEVKKLDIKPIFTEISNALQSLKISFVYFLSDASTTVFGALNTLLIGIYLSKSDISFWSVAMQLISAVQALYSPINQGIYPHMVREKNIKFVLKIFSFLFPVVIAGTVFSFIAGEWIITIVSGEKYRDAVVIFRQLLPLLIISFPTMLFGWPCLGAINKQKQVTFSTITAAVVQIVILVLMIIFDKFTLLNVALVRIISEICLCSIRVFFCVKHRGEFTAAKKACSKGGLM